MGAAHSQGWRTAGHVFDLPMRPVLAAICGRDAGAVRAAADRHGWAAAETDWRALIARDDVDLVDICTPGDSHAEIAIAALAAGKHVLCEKPLANTVAEAEAMTAAAEAAPRPRPVGDGRLQLPPGARHRATPARMVAEGRLGTLRHVRVTYLQDWLVDPEFPLTWRLRKEHGRLRRARRPGRAHRRPRPVPGGGAAGRGLRADRDLRTANARCPAAPTSGLAAAAAAGTGRGHRGRRGAVHRPLRLGRPRLLRGDPVSRPAARTPCASNSTANAARWPSTWNASTNSPSTTAPNPAPTRASGASSSPNPTTPTWRPGGRRATASATSTPSSTRPATSSTRSPTGSGPEPSFADGLQVQRVLAAVEESAEKNSVYTPVIQPHRSEEARDMPRDFTLFTGQWADLPLEEVCRLARDFGYDGLELACWGDHFEVDKALADPSYLTPGTSSSTSTASSAGRSPTTWSARPSATPSSTNATRRILPARIWGDGEPEGVRRRAAAEIEGHRAGRGRLRRRHRHRLHRLRDLAPGRHVPAGPRVDDRARLRGLRRRAGTRSSTSSTPRACGSPTRSTRARSPTTTGRLSAPWRPSATGPRSA